MASVANAILLSLPQKQSEPTLREVAIEWLDVSEGSYLQPEKLFFRIGFSACGQCGVLR
jgi:hypothetical protein